MSSSRESPEALVRRIRTLADKRQREAAREGREVAYGLMNAAHGYRVLADALERQPPLTWLRPASHGMDVTPAPEPSDFADSEFDVEDDGDTGNSPHDDADAGDAADGDRP